MDSDQRIQRAVVQKLESLRRAGVECLPRSTFVAPPATTPAAVVATPEVASPPPTAAVTNTAAASSAAPAAITPAAPGTTAASAEPVTTPASGIPIPTIPNPQSVVPTATASGERPSALQILAEEVAGCTACPQLSAARTQTVFGKGNPNARIVFFGEAPGAEEDRAGQPFVGKAGQLLTKIIEACTFSRDDVYIMNVLKCRPPSNRNPTPEETIRCRPFFEKQLEIIQPEFICCLGAVATTTLLDTTLAVGRLRGKFHEYQNAKVVVTYHPAYLLRNPDAKKLVWADMKMLMSGMGIPLPTK